MNLFPIAGDIFRDQGLLVCGAYAKIEALLET